MSPQFKIIGIISCSVALCLSLANATQAAESMKPDPCADRKAANLNVVKCKKETRHGIRDHQGRSVAL